MDDDHGHTGLPLLESSVARRLLMTLQIVKQR
jgi:hypothetical protein